MTNRSWGAGDRQHRKQAGPRLLADGVPKYSFKLQADGISPIQNKVGAFLADPKLRRILTRQDGQIRLRQVMDEGKVLLVNLSQGRIGADSAALLGGLLVTSLGSAAFSRAYLPEDQRRPFFLYADQFQSFTTLARQYAR